MFYRESGDFKESYAADQQTFPIRFDRIAVAAVLVFAFAVVPFLINDYWEKIVSATTSRMAMPAAQTSSTSMYMP